MSNTVNDSAIKKLKLLFTIVDKPKGEFYMDIISQFEVNCQMALSGLGTAQSELVELLGLNIHKAVILSVAREDQVGPIMDCLEEKFATIKKGKGISFMENEVLWHYRYPHAGKEYREALGALAAIRPENARDPYREAL